ncbi:MAG: molybdopterin-dependent oxidoreductase [Sulfolobales archaeon]|nr:molybdopterin-dependent oxidoreductase [Sulfolobales archaeon]MDW8010294.1 molybdopterin-dependent oxidoreductase [Sulfolobales archaeon]
MDHFIIYRAFGTPTISVEKWRLVVSGMVSNPLELSLSDLEKMPRVEIVRDFHCVTGWSVPSVRWEGIKLKLIADMAKPSESVRWAVVSGLDGYAAVVPFEDFVSEESLLVLKLNGKPLPVDQGFPARIFIPHLYGWKSVKWVSRVEFTNRYVDGYWEALGYHERGNAFLEERFKETST